MRWTEIKEKRIRLEDSESILINPVFNELNTFIQKCREQSVRGMLDTYDDVYVWDAMYASHRDMKERVIPKAETDFSFYIATKKENLSPTWGEDGGGVHSSNIIINKINGLYVSVTKKLQQSNDKNFWRIFR